MQAELNRRTGNAQPRTKYILSVDVHSFLFARIHRHVQSSSVRRLDPRLNCLMRVVMSSTGWPTEQ